MPFRLPSTFHPSTLGDGVALMLRIGIAVVLSEGLVLVGRRGSDVAEANRAEFPGGKCEPGEEPRDAAVRECREETGLDVEPVAELEVSRAENADGRIELHFWACAVRGSEETGEPDGTPTPPFRWQPVRALDPGDFPGPNAGVIRQLQSS